VKFRILFFLCTILIIVALFFVSVFTQTNKSPIKQLSGVTYVEIGSTTIPVEIADTEQSRIMGLSGRKTLPIDTGMFFVFDVIGRNEIWMKDMNFPIDIIWIDAEFKVVDITKNAVPESFPKTFEPRTPVLYVLETIAGWADKNGIKMGDKVLFSRQ